MKLAIALTLASVVAVGSAAIAQPPRVVNGRVDAQAAGNRGLEQTVRSIAAAATGGAWIGYTVAGRAGQESHCWSDSHGKTQKNTDDVIVMSPVHLEGSGMLDVLLRVEAGQVERIRILPTDCELDTGGLTLHWINDVNPAQSVALLTTFVSRLDDRQDHVRDNAITAIALHGDDSADSALETFAAPGQAEEVRKKAVFWLGQARGRRGFQTVQRIAREDASDAVRKSAIFSLSQSSEPEAVPALIQLAREDRSAQVRGEAIFWLAQKAGRQAAEAITERIEQDPDTQVKKRAVFALSQLPKDEGVPLLIQVARTNRNPAVRKQAMFWLGQSKDPRALEFFAEILK
ncbi:MAG TPA: HEAT repeat domain-containing protein [Vicinamibacterales bacterium]|nr:HEAT repeat domain-containing protein [Vicinamibacterales bacterium]